MGSRVLQEKLCHLKSTCIQAKQLQYNNDIHYVLMIFIFLHIRRFCISKGGSVPLPSDMRGSTVLPFYKVNGKLKRGPLQQYIYIFILIASGITLLTSCTSRYLMLASLHLQIPSASILHLRPHPLIHFPH